MGVSVSGRSEFADASARRAQAGAACWWLMECEQTATRQLLAFLRSSGESQQAWEGLLRDLYRRGLEGQQLKLIVTDGCAGLAAAIANGLSAGGSSALLGAQDAQHSARRCASETTTPSSRMLKRSTKRPTDQAGRSRLFSRFQPALADSLSRPWFSRLEKDLPDLLTFFSFPKAPVEKAAHHQCD